MIKGALLEETKGLQAYESACTLLGAVDDLSYENSEHTEMMTKPCLRLVQFAFPQIISVFAD